MYKITTLSGVIMSNTREPSVQAVGGRMLRCSHRDTSLIGDALPDNLPEVDVGHFRKRRFRFRSVSNIKWTVL